MKKWYQSPLCKGLLLLLSHISVGLLTVCLLIGLIYPGHNMEELLFQKEVRRYEDTKSFASEMQAKAVDLLEMIRWKGILFTDGKFDQDKVIDIETFDKNGEVAKEPTSFSYRVQDLIEMPYEESMEILVCKTPSKKLVYRYMTTEEFANVVREEHYTFPQEEEYGRSVEDVLMDVEENHISPAGEIVNEKGEQVYSSIWFASIQQFGNEKTVSGKSMIELANEEAHWNGHLTDMSDMLHRTCSSVSDYYYYIYLPLKDNFSQGQTNLFYVYVNYDEGTIESNEPGYSDLSLKDRLPLSEFDALKKKGKYVVIAPTLAQCQTNLPEDHVMLSQWKATVESLNRNVKDYLFIVGVDVPFQIQDEFYEQNKIYEKYMPWANGVLEVGMVAAVVFLICFVWLTAIAGHSNRQEGIVLTFYDQWKTELWLGVMGALSFGILLTMNLVDGYVISWDQMTQSGGISIELLFIFSVAAMLAYACAMTVYLSFVRVIKAKTLWKNSITRWACKIVGYIWKQRSYVTKQIVVSGALVILNCFMITGNVLVILFIIGADLVCILYLIRSTIERERVKEGVLKIAGGDIAYKISLQNLNGENKYMAEQINHIGEGIQAAVEKSLKDERLKTDLITNVSHDIKTPLTSIINYVGLLKQEHFDDPKIEKYLDILDQKSQRLKTLTEDVVEASKISSGNIRLEFVCLNLVEMVHQTVGECTEKFEKKNLHIILNVPEEAAVIRADGRRMWRVLENVFNNAAKYSMPGTRVYADVELKEKEVLFSLKNISEYPLNICADELTERFIRGDVSRSTEGSGLGLSIAKNLTQMQGGKFHLHVDGDLFKVTITFPRVKQEEKASIILD